jgi:hypothetical protein
MSLNSPYVCCSDSKWYKDPVWRGPDWFVCYDDDDPPEIIIKADSKLSFDEALKLCGHKACATFRFRGGVERVFDKEGVKFARAKSCFFKPSGLPRPPDEFGAVFDEAPSVPGVFYAG